MHSTSLAEMERPSRGTLFVVATPIGHLGDITLRALDVLAEVETIAAEDTRHTRKILSRYKIKTPLVSLHDHNKEKKTPQIVAKLHAGASVAVVSDAGTPSVSDPGYYLVKRCVEEGVRVIPIPGASAVIAALSVSGLPSDGFVFVGFAPRKATKRQYLLEELKKERRTLVFYESPRRLLALMGELIRVIGNREAVLARELTKVHEEILRGKLEGLIVTLKERPELKGECTLLVSGDRQTPPVEEKELRERLAQLRCQGDRSLSDVAKEVAAVYGLPRKQVYDTILVMEKKKDTGKKKGFSQIKETDGK